MKDATLAQGNQVLNLILQTRMPAEQLQAIIASGLLSDLLNANVVKINREEFRCVCGLKPLAPHPIIDCDSTPYIPDGWKVEEKDQLPGRVRGQFVWDPAKVKLHLSPNQQNGKWINGTKLQKELANEPVLPANILDFLLKNPHLIPEEWKKDESGNTRYTFFWGTIYRVSLGRLCVRYLYFRVGRWHCNFGWLDVDWDACSPAALRASS